MPTSRPRYLLTESDDLRSALEAARQRWPEDHDRPTALLIHLIDEGRRTVETAETRRREARRAAIRSAAEGLEGAYSDGYLAELRVDWPE